MQDTPDTAEIVDEIPADLVTPPDMPSSIQSFAPIAEGIEMTALGLRITLDEIEAPDFHRIFNSVIAMSRASSWLKLAHRRYSDFS